MRGKDPKHQEWSQDCQLTENVVAALFRRITAAKARLAFVPPTQLHRGQKSILWRMRAKIRGELAKIKPGATQCPGKLSRNLGTTLRELRPRLEAMARAGEIRFYQHGRRVEPGQFRGPFRVRGE